ncbi:MAG: response regulator [Cyclobacteriaceae bacterium]|nr:response regulator [Cyclobacteriaceae bacterium]
MAKVLICDDSFFQRKIVSDILNENGHDVIAVSDGNEAIEKISAMGKEIECALFDVLMPGITGPELLAKVKNIMPELPVIMLSADIQDSRKKECFDLGAIDFLNKPAKKEELLGAISKAISG